MGIGGISIWQLLIILVIVLLLFGTKRLKGFGGDLGSAIKGFKKAMSEEDEKKNEDPKKVEEDKPENNTESASSDKEKDSVKTESK